MRCSQCTVASSTGRLSSRRAHQAATQARSIAPSCSTTSTPVPAPAPTLEDVLSRAALGAAAAWSESCSTPVRLAGTGTALGMPMHWSLQWAPDSCSFREQLTLRGTASSSFQPATTAGSSSSSRSNKGNRPRSSKGDKQLPSASTHPALSFPLHCTYDAATATLLQSDLSGLSHSLAQDDDALDCALLSTWLRSGQWLTAIHAGHLHASLHHPSPAAPEPGPAAQPPVQAAVHPAAAPATLRLNLPGSPVSAHLTLGPSGGGESQLAYTPLCLETCTHSGGPDRWEWPQWPWHVRHTLSSGQVHEYLHNPGAGDAAGPGQATTQQTATPPDSAGTEQGVAAGREQGGEAGTGQAAANPGQGVGVSEVEVEVVRCDGGQVLVHGHVGERPAWFVLDPCCDTSALSTAAADSASLPAYGCQLLHGLSGTLSAPLRSGTALHLGPVSLPASALHQQVNLDGVLLSGGAGLGGSGSSAVAGLAGGAFLHRCVLELRLPKRRPGASAPPKPTARVFAPGHAPEPPVQWQALRFIDGMPHTWAGLVVGEEDGGREAAGYEGWFRLALGVGGTGMVLAAGAAGELGLLEAAQPLAPRGLMAGPGEGRGRLAALDEGALLSARLGAVRLGAATAAVTPAVFRQVRCVVHTHSLEELRVGGLGAAAHPHAPPDLQLSRRASGLLCADMFRSCTLLLDFPNSRMSVWMHSASRS